MRLPGPDGRHDHQEKIRGHNSIHEVTSVLRVRARCRNLCCRTNGQEMTETNERPGVNESQQRICYNPQYNKECTRLCQTNSTDHIEDRHSLFTDRAHQVMQPQRKSPQSHDNSNSQKHADYKLRKLERVKGIMGKNA